MTNWYEELGLERSDSLQNIQWEIEQKILNEENDAWSEGHSERLAKLKEAKAIFASEESREKYDADLSKPSDFAKWVSQANEQYEAGQYSLALTALEHALSTGNAELENAKFFKLAAFVYLKNSKQKESLESIDKAILAANITQEAAPYWISKASIHRDITKIAENEKKINFANSEKEALEGAISAAQKSGDKHNEAKANAILAEAWYYQPGRNENTAFAYAEKALQIDPNQSKAKEILDTILQARATRERDRIEKEKAEEEARRRQEEEQRMRQERERIAREKAEKEAWEARRRQEEAWRRQEEEARRRQEEEQRMRQKKRRGCLVAVIILISLIALGVVVGIRACYNWMNAIEVTTPTEGALREQGAYEPYPPFDVVPKNSDVPYVKTAEALNGIYYVPQVGSNSYAIKNGRVYADGVRLASLYENRAWHYYIVRNGELSERYSAATNGIVAVYSLFNGDSPLYFLRDGVEEELLQQRNNREFQIKAISPDGQIFVYVEHEDEGETTHFNIPPFGFRIARAVEILAISDGAKYVYEQDRSTLSVRTYSVSVGDTYVENEVSLNDVPNGGQTTFFNAANTEVLANPTNGGCHISVNGAEFKKIHEGSLTPIIPANHKIGDSFARKYYYSEHNELIYLDETYSPRVIAKYTNFVSYNSMPIFNMSPDGKSLIYVAKSLDGEEILWLDTTNPDAEPSRINVGDFDFSDSLVTTSDDNSLVYIANQLGNAYVFNSIDSQNGLSLSFDSNPLWVMFGNNFYVPGNLIDRDASSLYRYSDDGWTLVDLPSNVEVDEFLSFAVYGDNLVFSTNVAGTTYYYVTSDFETVDFVTMEQS